MTKTDIVNSLAESMELSKAQSKKILDNILGQIETAIASGDSVQLAGFGTFKPVVKPKRTVKLTGFARGGGKKNVTIPEHLSVRFKAGEGLKAKLNEKKSGKKSKK